MKATSITQIEFTIVPEIKQELIDRIEKAEIGIKDSLFQGDIDSATQSIRDLADCFENKIWAAYLNALSHCRTLLAWLRVLGTKKALRFVSYQDVSVTLPTGGEVRIRSPFFVKAKPKKGRKKRGPQNRGEHLLLSLLGFVRKVESRLAFHAVSIAVSVSSFETASMILAGEGVKMGANRIRLLVRELAPSDLRSRVLNTLKEGEIFPLKNRRVLLGVDGGRLRSRKNKRGPVPADKKRRGFHTDWIEPKLFTIHLLDEDGEILKDTPPFVDGTTGKLNEFLSLLETYLSNLGVNKASEVILVGDGAPWIWERVPSLIRKIAGADLKISEIIDWTHAKQNLKKAFDPLSAKKSKLIDFDYFKDLLFSGKIREIVAEAKRILNLKRSSRTMKKLKSYFISNEKRMQYEFYRDRNCPIGSGVIESAIRRVVNLRVKAPGSFWHPPFAEMVIYLRAQFLYGRWDSIVFNWNALLLKEFKIIASMNGCRFSKTSI
jgi:hypothetical protein